MKIALIIGECPPGGCGVGDFAYSLAEAMRRMGVNVETITSKDWSLTGALKETRSSRISSADVVHLQYPTQGFGSKLGPQLLSLLCPAVITIHEVSRVHALRKLSMMAFALRSKAIIFTSEYERTFVLHYMPWLADGSQVIPIGNSVPIKKLQRKATSEILSFGLIRPEKGIEQVVELALLIKQASLPYRVRIVGRTHPHHLNYVQKLREQSPELPIIWDCDLTDEKVSCLLANAAVAYLPFPDGASERRSTLKTLLANEVSVVTTRGKFTPNDLEGVVRFAATPSDALHSIRALLEHPEQQRELAQKGKEYTRSYSWDRIAQLYINLYKDLLSGPTIKDLR
ncbi:MAG: glycosyl transferase, group 1 family protein [Acidobacteriales bacterium]|nr:glycosyl transferase, group 1 family protein [Terriglobales bacterium]